MTHSLTASAQGHPGQAAGACRRMKCTLCGNEFDVTCAQRACQACPFRKGCSLVKCPNCGFEMPPEPKWLKRLMKKRKNPEI